MLQAKCLEWLGSTRQHPGEPSWLQEPKGPSGTARVAWKGSRKTKSMETGSVLFACWIRLQARSIKELNLDFMAEIIAWHAKDSLAGQQVRLWLGSAAPQAGQHLLLFHSLPSERETAASGTMWVTQASHGHQSLPHTAASLPLTSPPPCFSPEDILSCGKFRSSRWGWGQAQGQQGPLGTAFPLLPLHRQEHGQGWCCSQAQQPACPPCR